MHILKVRRFVAAMERFHNRVGPIGLTIPSVD
jgi:hypothetical protein